MRPQILLKGGDKEEEEKDGEKKEEEKEEVYIFHYFTALGPHLSLSCLQTVLQAV